jgi:anti-anti-sigma factor
MLADVQLDDVDGVPVARVRGEIDMSNADDVSATLQKSVPHSAAGLVIDFTPAAYLDSAGLHVLFDLGKRLRDRGQRLQLVVPAGSPVAGVLDVVLIDALAPRSATVAEAVGKLRSHGADVPAPPAGKGGADAPVPPPGG